jgi:3-oxoacyl-[acyl-carrier-protein] synthase-3
MLESVQRRAEVSDARHLYNVERRGNTGAAGAPSVLSELWDAPREQVGDAVGLAVVGSGLAWAGVLLERTL